MIPLIILRDVAVGNREGVVVCVLEFTMWGIKRYSNLRTLKLINLILAIALFATSAISQRSVYRKTLCI
jgi:hypothetical protein